TIAPDLKDRTLIVNGASKAYAMTGWRLGIGAGPSSLMGGVRKILGQSTSNPCSITQYAGIAAFGGEQGFLKEWVATFHRRRDKVVKAINAIAGLSCLTPQGAFYVYPSCVDLIGKGGITNDVDFAERLLESEAVAVVPGAAFGLSPYFRISYATDDATLEEACARIARFCEGMT
ncbi:MAG: aminotransferase class I/II-fold pyridoxal phosphate-dependent enzyme, partial [Pseudomonadota bacterium]